ncbi:MAG: methyltransferase domain-containing protein [Firmicutes bacterium]|nr:methyltransferase domain-containing protein [Bacillota bacterium]
MCNNSTSYFNQSQVWDKDALTYQKHVLHDILAVLPNNVQSILDVGCGDGLITNALPAAIKVVGLDLSEEALKRVNRETVLGNVTNIPFPDAAFDLVMANDILEHLTLQERIKGLAEIARVARKYVIITVPFLEDLSVGAVKCAGCGFYYHINHHFYSFGLKETRDFLVPHGFKPVAQILSGDVWLNEPPEVVYLKRLFLSELGDATGAICPKCGSRDIDQDTHLPFLSSVFNSLHASLSLDRRHLFNLRTECISLYSKETVLPHGEKGFVDSSGMPVELDKECLNNNEIDFTRKELFKKEFLPKYSVLPYYVHDSQLTDPADINEEDRLMLGFFCGLDERQPVVLRISGTAKGTSGITVYTYDDYKSYHSPVNVQVSGEFSVDLAMPEAGLSIFGLLFELRVKGSPVSISKISVLNTKCENIAVFKNKEKRASFQRLSGSSNLYVSLSLYGDYIIQNAWMDNPDLIPDEIGYSVLDETCNELNKKIFGVLADKYELFKNESTIIFNEYGQLKGEHANLHNAFQNLNGQYEQLYAKQEVLSDDYERLNAKHEALSDDYKKLNNEQEALSEDYGKLSSEYQALYNAYSKTFRYRFRHWIVKLGCGGYESFSAYKEKILKYAQPASWNTDWLKRVKNQKSFLMICHDQQIDRRIIQQAKALIKTGWHGIIVALSFNESDRLDNYEGIDVHRIGLARIVPECPVYWRYQNRQRIINWWGRWINNLSKINWKVYKLNLLLHYRCRSISHPLPFDNVFYAAARNYLADLIVAHDLPALKAASRLADEWNVPLVYDAHELYYEQKTFSSRQKTFMFGNEKELIQKCAEVFCVNLSIAEEMACRYGIVTPHVLLNAIDSINNGDGSGKKDLIRQHFGLPANIRVILYQGGLLANRNLETTAKAMRYIKSKDVVLVFIGSGHLLHRLEKTARRFAPDKILFKEAVPQEELLNWTASADIGIVPYPHVDLNTYYCTPNKLFEYIQAGLPIIANDLPELRRFVEDTGFGKVGLMNNPRNMAALIDSAVMDTGFIVKAKENIIKERYSFSWATAADEYTRIINGLMNESSSLNDRSALGGN